MNPQFNDFGDTAQALPSIFPQSLSGSSAVNGSSVNRQITNGNSNSCVVSARLGASTGSPSAYSVTYQVQHSTASGSGFANYTDAFGNSSFTLTQSSPAGTSADNLAGHLNIDLSGANQYVRVVATPSFTSGTSPTVPASVDIVLGGFDGSTALPATYPAGA